MAADARAGAFLSGAFVIDKPPGVSSSQGVARIKHALLKSGRVPKNFRIGHGGTLDPFASGVLVVLLGEATKLSDAYLHSRKTYTGLIALGVQTDSGDPTGSKTGEAEVPKLGPGEWQALADTFVSEPYWQTPPMHSAKKRGGVALYELARKGLTVERKPLLKRIESFSVIPNGPLELRFETACESGTYVRVLAEDLAKKAGTLAHLRALRRTRSSDRVLEEAATLEAVEEGLRGGSSMESLPGFVRLARLASHLPSLAVSPGQNDELRAGLRTTVDSLLTRANSMEHPGRYLLLRVQDAPVGILERPGPESPYRLQRVIHGLF